MQTPTSPDSRVQRTLSIGAPAETLLRAWCDPQVQQRLLADWAMLVSGDEQRMVWSIRLPGARQMRLESRQAEAVPGQRVRYVSEGEHDVRLDTELSVRPAPADFGTEARLRVGYALPGGAVAETLVKWLGSAPERVLGTVLRRFKALLETGEVPTLERNPSAREDDRR
ncbi:hypothetical protein [Vulcaniibacterium tengchongense]|uniref:Polyketide cyclase/dehydrase/lipid transport protein n=1 Tax=Vulcaniibacterium tengchongense TaxID=1273429 RepID=A0A3N4VRV7_9GAMM|nr:hypothetical protein [Vulcaniibacterium tengchongense]RPE81941.1 hypothetical protein EDC50_1144 [Vulcaniibacterium tengchongense]